MLSIDFIFLLGGHVIVMLSFIEGLYDTGLFNWLQRTCQ